MSKPVLRLLNRRIISNEYFPIGKTDWELSVICYSFIVQIGMKASYKNSCERTERCTNGFNT